jgi:hypothetical protein
MLPGWLSHQRNVGITYERWWFNIQKSEFQRLQDACDSIITIQGQISHIYQAHLEMSFSAYPFSQLFDLSDGYQTILYSKIPLEKELEEGRDYEITGKVVKIQGVANQPGEPEHKADEKWVEYHILVDSWRKMKS